jgi:NADPH:quinone reductase-like Zn-dependent oxidoreductase
VTRHKVGDEVFGISSIRQAGAFADYLVVDEKAAYRKPTSLSFDIAAALPMASVTAWSAVMDRAKVGSGQTVFVAGCLGGLGRAAVQIALMRGAEVIGNCNAAGREEALALGVAEVADYRAFDISSYRRRFDLVFDTPGALTLDQCRAMLKPGGVAVHAVPTPRTIFASLFSPRHAIASGNPTPQRLAGVGEAAALGELVPKIGSTVPLSAAIAALAEVETASGSRGKLVIVPA